MDILIKTNYEKYLDRTEFAKYEKFLHKVNEKWECQYGLRETYDNEGDIALAYEVDYFGFYILQDDRMRYIIENIVNSNISEPNKIGNTIISHFYGARGIHQILSGNMNPKEAHIDFERIAANDIDYLDSIKENARIGKEKKQKFYGTTELHTSIQTAGRNFCRKKYNSPDRKIENTDILEWISDWTLDGTIDKILETKTLKDMFNLLCSKPGIGEYYGYHCATSNSVNTALPFHHDEYFCAPGPGARESLDRIFPGLKSSSKKMPYGDLDIFIRDNQETLFKKPIISHEFFHNYKIGDRNVFHNEQKHLTVYTTEVSLCQYGVYCFLTQNPHLISKRSIARLEDDSVCDLATETGLEKYFK